MMDGFMGMAEDAKKLGDRVNAAVEDLELQLRHGPQQTRRVMETIRDARDKAEDLLGEVGEQDGFVPVTDEGVRTLIDAAIERAAFGAIREAAFQIIGHGAVKITRTKSGGVKIERSRTLKRSEETV